MSAARDQVSRLLSLVPYLQRREVSVSDAARDFGVPAAQIVNDLQVLWMCGLPGLGPGDLIDIDFEAIEDDGVVRIDNADYLSRPIRLGSSEASALIVALRLLAEDGDAASAEVVGRALAKLESAVGASQPVEVYGVPPRPSAVEAAVLHAVDEAVAADRQLRLEYYVPTRDETTVRVVDPQEVFEADGAAYLDAWCHRAEARRSFRVDRILSAATLDSPREHTRLPREDRSSGVFRAGPRDLSATFVLDQSAGWVVEYYPVAKVAQRSDGRITATLQAADPRWLVRLALRLGTAGELVSPPELAEEVRRRAGAALALYRSPNDGPNGGSNDE